MNFPLKPADVKRFIGEKPVVEYRIGHEKFVGVAESFGLEIEEGISAIIVDYEWVVKVKMKPLVARATIVAAGTLEKRSMRFALPRFISDNDGILLIKCMGDMIVTLTNNTDELLDAARLKET